MEVMFKDCILSPSHLQKIMSVKDVCATERDDGEQDLLEGDAGFC